MGFNFGGCVNLTGLIYNLNSKIKHSESETNFLTSRPINQGKTRSLNYKLRASGSKIRIDSATY